MAKGFALYLIAAIGLKGGIAIAQEPLDNHFILFILSSVLFSAALPFLGSFLLKYTTSLGPIDRAAVAGHYGSVSLVTFIAAGEFLKLQSGIEMPGQFIAILAVMESPAILSVLLMAAPHLGQKGIKRRKRDIAREVFLNGTMVLLLGSMAIGAFYVADRIIIHSICFIDPFKGVLCFFLLDMGINIGRRSNDIAKLEPGTVAFSVVMALISGALALVYSYCTGIDATAAFLFTTLSASASYIAVPAALKIALPEANPALYLTLPLGLTFPFNVALGIPLYYAAVQWMYGL